MVKATQLSPGMVLSIKEKLYRVESSVKVTVPKGTPFIKSKLKSLDSEKVLEKNFKTDQQLDEVSRTEKNLEFLYLDGKDYRFLDVDDLEQVLIPEGVIGDDVNYLKEGIPVKAVFFGPTVFEVELPQFLELMVVDTEGEDGATLPVANVAKIAVLETGAKVEVPPFVEAGDVIKIDTRTEEYIQRV